LLEAVESLKVALISSPVLTYFDVYDAATDLIAMLVVVASELYYNKRIGMVTYDSLGPMTVSLSVWGMVVCT
jgi:hypothetical protein